MRYDAWDKRVQFRGTIVRARDRHEGHKKLRRRHKDPTCPDIVKWITVKSREHIHCEWGLKYGGNLIILLSRMPPKATNFNLDYIRITTTRSK